MNTTKQRLWLLGAMAAGMAGCGGGGGAGGGGPSTSPAPVANSAPTVDAEALVVVTSGASALLSATGNDADGDTLTYNWTQTRGTSVTNRQGFNTATPSFTPSAGQSSPVETLAFQVEVSDGRASTSTSVNVVVAKDASRAAFVDGTNGSDETGDGSIGQPYATISAAVSANGATDIYVRVLPAGTFYDERQSRIQLDAGRSLYGGFGDGWIRDEIVLKSVVATSTFGVQFTSIDQPTEISGMEIRAIAPTTLDLRRTPFLPVRALVADGGTAELRVINNRFIAEDATDAAVSNGNLGGSSLAVKIMNLPSAEISNNVIIAGNGAPGEDGESGAQYRSGPAPSGGDGGNGGTGIYDNGSAGGRGDRGTSSGCGAGGAGGSGQTADDGSNGVRGCPGANGAHGTGGAGYGGYQSGVLNGGFEPAASTKGSDGQHGGGGGGGGGGEASGTGGNGGRGGDGGTGGRGATGTLPATAGGASIGVEIYRVADARILNNEILAGQGGTGGEESRGNVGENGKFGFGGNSGEGFPSGGNGGDGGRGGGGGNGGTGGSGAGGPSYAIHIGEETRPIIVNNILQTGMAGERGLFGSRRTIPNPVWYGNNGWSVGIFTPINTLDLSGIGINDFLIGEVIPVSDPTRAPIAADIANRNGEISLP